MEVEGHWVNSSTPEPPRPFGLTPKKISPGLPLLFLASYHPRLLLATHQISILCWIVLLSGHAFLGGSSQFPLSLPCISALLQQAELKLELQQDFPTVTSHRNGKEKKEGQLGWEREIQKVCDLKSGP